MLDIKRSGSSLAGAAAAMLDVPERVIPYAAATALTRTVKAAQQDVVQGMRVGFDRPTAYTLNATRIEVATVQKLSARVAVKDQASGGTVPEHFLLPEVRGGGRREKRFEAAMRNAGFMAPGERAMPGAAAQRDAFGNVAQSTLRSVLGQGRKGGKIFVGSIGRNGTRGVWQRDGRSVKPLFVFTTRLPQYTPRVDFTAIAEATSRRTFEGEFVRAAAELQARFA